MGATLLDPRTIIKRQAREERDPYRMGEAPEEIPTAGHYGSYFRSAPFPMPDLLSAQDIAGMLQLSLPSTMTFIHDKLPLYAVLRVGREIRVHSWAIAHVLKMAEQCPGCGKAWEVE